MKATVWCDTVLEEDGADSKNRQRRNFVARYVSMGVFCFVSLEPTCIGYRGCPQGSPHPNCFRLLPV